MYSTAYSTVMLDNSLHYNRLE